MNMFARFNENPAMTLQDIKKKKCYGRTDARTDYVKTVYPPQTKFAGGITRTHGRENSIPTTNKVCGGYKNKVCRGYNYSHSRDVILTLSLLAVTFVVGL